MKNNCLLLFLLSQLLSGCYKENHDEKIELTHVQFFDRNGVNETIAKKERLDAVKNIDFLKNQPYEKVVRVYKRDNEGKIYSVITSYHDNGQIFQYLEVIGGRARGRYREWYENSNLRIDAKLMEGVGDLSKEAQTSWIFDGENKVYHVNGGLHAELYYDKGKLQGLMKYYDSDGFLAKTILYQNDKINGEKKTYLKNGSVLSSVCFENDVLNGKAFHIGDHETGSYEEDYDFGKLVMGKYYNFKNELTHEVFSGCGIRANYSNGFLISEEEYKDGIIEGVCKFYRKNGTLEKQYTVYDGEKNGPLYIFYDKEIDDKDFPKRAMIDYKDGEITGKIMTWYYNGKIESEKQMSSNMKQGKLFVWYEDGSLMMMEEYEADILTQGKYLKIGDNIPVSRVINGCGTVTLFDAKGNFIKKFEVEKGVPGES